MKFETSAPASSSNSSACRRSAVTDDLAARRVAAANGYSHDNMARSLFAVAASSANVFL